MTRFFMKCFLLSTILMLGIFIGMLQANSGIDKLDGIEGKHLHQLNGDEDELETVSPTDKFTSDDLIEKQKKLEHIQSFNIFSSLGTLLSNVLSLIMESFITIIFKIIDIVI